MDEDLIRFCGPLFASSAPPAPQHQHAALSSEASKLPLPLSPALVVAHSISPRGNFSSQNAALAPRRTWEARGPPTVADLDQLPTIEISRALGNTKGLWYSPERLLRLETPGNETSDEESLFVSPQPRKSFPAPATGISSLKAQSDALSLQTGVTALDTESTGSAQLVKSLRPPPDIRSYFTTSGASDDMSPSPSAPPQDSDPTKDDATAKDTAAPPEDTPLRHEPNDKNTGQDRRPGQEINIIDDSGSEDDIPLRYRRVPRDSVHEPGSKDRRGSRVPVQVPDSSSSDIMIERDRRDPPAPVHHSGSGNGTTQQERRPPREAPRDFDDDRMYFHDRQDPRHQPTNPYADRFARDSRPHKKPTMRQPPEPKETPPPRKKPGPKPWAVKPISKNDMNAKKELIKEIEQYWGKGFIRAFIPKCHRPLIKRGKKRSVYREHENDPKKWMPSVLKAVLMIAKKTDDKAWLKKAMGEVVRYRIKNTGNRKPQLVTTDFDVIEDMLVKGWAVDESFGIRYKHLMQYRRPEEADEDIEHIMEAGSDRSSNDEQREDDEDADAMDDDQAEYDEQQKLGGRNFQSGGFTQPPQYHQPQMYGRGHGEQMRGQAPPRAPMDRYPPPMSGYGQQYPDYNGGHGAYGNSTGRRSTHRPMTPPYSFGEPEDRPRKSSSAKHIRDRSPMAQPARRRTLLDPLPARSGGNQYFDTPKIKREPDLEQRAVSVDSVEGPTNFLGGQDHREELVVEDDGDDDDEMLQAQLAAAEAEAKRAQLQYKILQRKQKKKA
ncbi:hypothetical protein BDV95DRAFT_595733 [Massariosphaeria phaeospora]|uniref:Uncharacterized protein n=1 Tax=Massariosphaeria phaeospora TaxID=100035 RepID=A0A7C8IBU1_9PLEO|nr:hypothetical protein BDV95DRAFT_595733 [Massariosphaeria phaeospora]